MRITKKWFILHKATEMSYVNQVQSGLGETIKKEGNRNSKYYTSQLI
jgi:hypothetical protein